MCNRNKHSDNMVHNAMFCATMIEPDLEPPREEKTQDTKAGKKENIPSNTRRLANNERDGHRDCQTSKRPDNDTDGHTDTKTDKQTDMETDR